MELHLWHDSTTMWATASNCCCPSPKTSTLNAPHWSGRSLRMLLNFSSLSRCHWILSGEKYPMISVQGPLLAEIWAKVEFTEDDTPTLCEVKKVLATDMHTRYQDRRVTEVLNISSFLDPRFKLSWPKMLGTVWREEMLEHPQVITRRSRNPAEVKSTKWKSHTLRRSC